MDRCIKCGEDIKGVCDWRLVGLFCTQKCRKSFNIKVKQVIYDYEREVVADYNKAG